MTAGQDKGGDLFGIKPLGEATKLLTEAVVAGAGAFLGRICLPAAEEFGLLLRDKVHAYRTKNVLAVLARAEEMVEQANRSGSKALPRLVSNVLEEASWMEDQVLQDRWAGLLASACTPDGKDDSNVLFVDLLRRLTGVQIRILDYACQHAVKRRTGRGLIMSSPLNLDFAALEGVAGTNDLQRLDRELDHLRSLELLNEGGFPMQLDGALATVTPTPLALHLFVRCQGSQLSPVDFFGVE